MSAREGIRGGNVRSVQEARALQETHKPDYSAIVREAILTALRTKGSYHADDLAHLELPREHLNCIGSQVAALVKQGVMVEVARRKGTSAASNGRRSGVYEPTGVGVANREGSAPLPAPSRSGAPRQAEADAGLFGARSSSDANPGGHPGITELEPVSGAARLFPVEPA